MPEFDLFFASLFLLPPLGTIFIQWHCFPRHEKHFIARTRNVLWKKFGHQQRVQHPHYDWKMCDRSKRWQFAKRHCLGVERPNIPAQTKRWVHHRGPFAEYFSARKNFMPRGGCTHGFAGPWIFVVVPSGQGWKRPVLRHSCGPGRSRRSRSTRNVKDHVRPTENLEDSLFWQLHEQRRRTGSSQWRQHHH